MTVLINLILELLHDGQIKSDSSFNSAFLLFCESNFRMMLKKMRPNRGRKLIDTEVVLKKSGESQDESISLLTIS